MKLFDGLQKSVRALAREVKGTHIAPRLEEPKPCRIGLAFGGGFARGLAHVGILKVLEEEGIITRQTFAEVPPRVEYSLTEKGRDLVDVIESMRNYGKRWLCSE